MPVYDELQQVVAESSATGAVQRVLDIGTGTGETAAAVLHRHPGAMVWLVDESGDMLEAARQRLTPEQVERVSVADMRALPVDGEFDLVVSALAVHHLPTADKRAVFERVYALLRAGGRFVLAVVTADRPTGAKRRSAGRSPRSGSESYP
jgi:tRNA (cmo5U34)-methyltransferase